MNTIREQAEHGLRYLTDLGAAEALCLVSRGETREFNVDGGRFSLYRTLIDRAASMTAIVDKRRGSLSTNQVDDAALRRAAEDCVASAASAEADEAWGLAPNEGERAFDDRGADWDEERLFRRCEELLEQIKAEFPRILIEQMIVAHTQSESVAAYSTGSRFASRRSYYALTVMYSAHEGELASGFMYTGLRFSDLESPLLERSTLRADLEAVSRQVHSEALEGKFTGDLIFTPACLGEFLSYYCRNFVSESVILDKSSLFYGKLGEAVAHPALSLRVAPGDAAVVCGERYSGEGFLSEDYALIEKGVLRGYMLSLYGARKSGFPRAANGAENFVVDAGDSSLDALIRGTKQGLLIGRFSGGTPSIGGDFSGVAKNSFLIRDGKITTALRETMISGNLAEIFKRVRGISAERAGDGDVLLPYIAVEGVTVSGK